jgi:DNA-directed RNA polymerase I, II, and III subunit RPABC5
MLIPIRCYTCNKVIANKYEPYLKMISEDGLTSKEALDRLGLTRYCCRRMILGNVELIDKVLMYDNISTRELEE